MIRIPKRWNLVNGKLEIVEWFEFEDFAAMIRWYTDQVAWLDWLCERVMGYTADARRPKEKPAAAGGEK